MVSSPRLGGEIFYVGPLPFCMDAALIGRHRNLRQDDGERQLSFRKSGASAETYKLITEHDLMRVLALGKSTSALLQVLPFAVFAVMFLLVPTSSLLIGAFQDDAGQLTLANFRNMMTPSILNAYSISIQISAASAFLGAVLGTAVAWAIAGNVLPSPVRQAVTTLSGVASNFAGVPLAFAFIATLGRTGLLTALVTAVTGVNLYQEGFTIYNVTGLTLTYLYFQLPLMVLVILPAIDGLKKDWAEASAMLGATPFQHFLYVSLPILAPSVLGAMLLLFANAFGALATAFALTSGSINLITILLYAQIRGNVLHDPHLGLALAFGMVVITGLCNLAYLRLRAITDRRLK